MNKENKIICYTVIIGIIINLILPYIVVGLSDNDFDLSNKRNTISGKIVHVFIHTSRMPVTSSIIVGLGAALSVYLAIKLSK